MEVALGGIVNINRMTGNSRATYKMVWITCCAPLD